MNIKILLSLFLLVVLNYANAATHQFFVTNKDFSETLKIVEKYLVSKHYKVKQSDDKILEFYFDVPELIYLKSDRYIRYKAVEYISEKKKKVKYRESIEYSRDDNNTYTFPVKHYNNIKTFEGKHPLLTLVKRKEREIFLEKLQKDGLKYPMRLKKIVQVSKLVHTFDIYSDAIRIGSVRINKMKTSAFDIETEFIMSEIEIENNQVLNEELNNLLHNNQTIKNEYLVVYQQMEKNVSLFSWILRYPYLVNLLYAVSFSIFGLFIIFVLFRRKLIA